MKIDNKNMAQQSVEAVERERERERESRNSLNQNNDAKKYKNHTEAKLSCGFATQKFGISIIALVITVIVIVILSAIILIVSGNAVEKASFSMFVQEFSDIQGQVDAKRKNNELKGPAEFYANDGFTKVAIENPPEGFISFDEDVFSGYYVDMKYVQAESSHYGKGTFVDNKVTFGNEDVFVYDKTGKLWYVKGWINSEGERIHTIYQIETEEENKGPVIELVEYSLSTEKDKAIVRVVVEPINDGTITVWVDGIIANKIAENEYQVEIKRNGNILVKASEDGGGKSNLTVMISGIENLDTTPPIITSLAVTRTGDSYTINAEAKEENGKIVSYIFTNITGMPVSGWTRVSSLTSISTSYLTNGSGTYYFWVKNEAGLAASQSVIVPKITYEVTYNANGGANEPTAQTKIKGETLKLSDSEPTRDGYIFQGWATSEARANQGNVDYNSLANYTLDKEITLYAVWKLKTYKITYNANGGVGAPPSQTKSHGQVITLSNIKPTKTGYIFQGWATSEEDATISYQPRETYNRNENLNLYAVWKIETYEITYNANGGTGAPSNEEKTYNIDYRISNTEPTRTNYEFKGWATSLVDANNKIVSYLPNSTYTTNSKLDLFAVWEKIPEIYTIKYDKNGGIGTIPSNQTKTEEIPITLGTATLSKRRYTFDGWATSQLKANNGEVEYECGEEFNEDGNITLYAVWKSALIPSIANAPVLGAGMVATYWGDDNATVELTSDVFASNMYSYTIGDGITDTKDSKWANAKTEDGSYWVWIPRYAYKLIYYTDNTRTVVSDTKTSYGDVDLLFLYGTSNTEYRDKNGNAKPLPEGYIVHPAFQKMTEEEETEGRNPLGKWDSELQGIWIAKYEASREDLADDGVTWLPTTVTHGGSNNLTTNAGNLSTTKTRVVSKPSAISWRGLYESGIYENCRYMYPELNTHAIKNSEWGAVAYLTYSAYGRNGNELAVNQCSNYITGAGKGMGSSTVWNGTYAYTETDVLDAYGNIAQYAFEDNYSWHTPLGKLASTTGNIYGIYDMSGGAWEFVASYIAIENIELNYFGSNLVTSTITRYKQVYTSTLPIGTDAEKAIADYEANSEIYGDAIYETSIMGDGGTSWCNGYSRFLCGDQSFFIRGGFYEFLTSAGTFCFHRHLGSGGSDGGFRPVLCVE